MDEINVTRVISVAEFGVRNLYHVERTYKKQKENPYFLKFPKNLEFS